MAGGSPKRKVSLAQLIRQAVRRRLGMDRCKHNWKARVTPSGTLAKCQNCGQESWEIFRFLALPQ